MATFNNGESGLSVRTKINNVLQHADGTASELVINDAGADVNFRVESDTNTNALFVDGGTGDVGIGTSSPSVKLDIAGDSNLSTRARFANSSAGTTLQLGARRDVSFVPYIGSESNHAFAFITNDTERLRIDASGNVGIGTSSPTNLLDVNADSIRVRTSQTPATAGAAGNQGEIAWDADYIYVCVATNTWKRAAIATW